MSLYASNHVVVCCRLLYSSSRIAVGWQFAVLWRVYCTQMYAGGHVVVCCRLLHSDCTLYAVRWWACTLPVAVLWQSCHVTINRTLAGLYAVFWCTLEIMFLYAASCYSDSRVASQYAVGLYAVRWHMLVVASLCTAGCCTPVIMLLYVAHKLLLYTISYITSCVC